MARKCVTYPISIPIPKSDSPGNSHIYRNATHPDQLIDKLLDSEATTCWELFQIGRHNGVSKDFIGQRSIQQYPKDEIEKPTFGPYEWLSFKMVEEMALCAGSALDSEGLVPVREFPMERYVPARRLRPLAINCRNSVEWLIMEQAANAFGLTIVPLYLAMRESEASYILSLTKCATILVDVSAAMKVAEIAKQDGVLLTNVILTDFASHLYTESKAFKSLRDSDLNVITWKNFMKLGQISRKPASLVDPSTVQTICFTSGTTGNPKGVILTHQNFVATVAAAIRGVLHYPTVHIYEADRHYSYLPMAHVYERIVCALAAALGAKVGVASGGVTTMMEDIQLLRPSLFVAVPRVFEKMAKKITTGLAEKSLPVQYMFDMALNIKLKRLHRTGDVRSPILDAIVFKKFRDILGGNVRFMLSGGSPMDSSLQNLICCLFSCPLLQGYGLTETLGGSFCSIPGSEAGLVGSPFACLEFQLRDVPEMNYFVSKEPPSGEIRLRGHSLTVGYFMNPVETEAAIDKDGWFGTGDIGTLHPTGALQIVDRKKALFKLSQGEYISPDNVEGYYMACLYIDQIFVTGWANKPYPVAIVVPSKSAAQKWAERNNKAVDIEAICASKDFNAEVYKNMNEVATKLRGFEKVKKISFSATPFSIDNDLLTPTLKLKRAKLTELYRQEIEKMYKEMDQEDF